MPSYREYMQVPNPKDASDSWLKTAIKSMANAANKRLKRMEQKGQTYIEGREENVGKEGYTAGYKRFTVRGKNHEELLEEFKRVRRMLTHPLGSLTKIKKEMERTRERIANQARPKRKEQEREMTESEKKNLAKMRKNQKTSESNANYDRNKYRFDNVWDEMRWWTRSMRMYQMLVDEGIYTPNKYDSDRVRDMCMSVVYDTMDELTFEQQYERLKKMVDDYVKADDRFSDVDTSSFFTM